MDSRLRNSVGVEVRRLEERLRKLKWYDSQFPAEMTEIDQGVKRLQKRLVLLSQMELVLNRYWRQRSGRLPLSVTDRIEELRRQVVEILNRAEPTDADTQVAQALIQKMDERLTTGGDRNRDIAERLIRDTTELKADFDVSKGQIGTSPIWREIFSALGTNFDPVLVAATPTDPDSISPRDYVMLERLVFILQQVRDFITLAGAANTSATLGPRVQRLLAELVAYLRGDSWDDLRRAHRVVRKMREGIDDDDVEEEILGNRVSIEMSRSFLRQFEPTDLRIVFLDKRINAAAARDEFSCEWDFGHDWLKERGWSISHYFPEPSEREKRPPQWLWWIKEMRQRLASRIRHESYREPYQVRVSFIRDDGKVVPREAVAPIRVWPQLRMKVRASLWIELSRLSLALAIAAAGLIAGARDQILKLDTFPALIAVFLLGFGSDRIKNMFVQPAPQGSSEAKPPSSATETRGSTTTTAREPSPSTTQG